MWWRALSLLPSAVERSWTADFVGQRTVTALENHVKQQMTMGKRYARYCSIVQSSGMGKSRLLDEFAKEHFLIPINLRPKGGEGVSCPFHLYGLSNSSVRSPPADDQVREFLTSPQCYRNKDAKESSRSGRAVSSKHSFASPRRPSRRWILPAVPVPLREKLELKSSGSSCQRGKLWAPQDLTESIFTKMLLSWQQMRQQIRYAVPVSFFQLFLTRWRSFAGC